MIVARGSREICYNLARTCPPYFSASSRRAAAAASLETTAMNATKRIACVTSRGRGAAVRWIATLDASATSSESPTKPSRAR